MRRFTVTLLVAASVAMPQLAIDGHADGELLTAAAGRSVVVTGHERPEPAPHIEPLSGTTELHCLGCLLDKRESARTFVETSAARPQNAGPLGAADPSGRRSLELAADGSPRAPPPATPA